MITGGEKQSLEPAAEPAVAHAHLLVWICAVLLLLSAVGASHYLRGPRLKPTITSWRIARHELRLGVTLVNTSRHPLYYSHHPFPARYMVAGKWRDADVLNAYRSTRLEPGAKLFAEVLVPEPDRRPAHFQIGTDFEVRRTMPAWLIRLEGSLAAKPFSWILRPMLQSWVQPKPVPCIWSDAVSINGEGWERPE